MKVQYRFLSISAKQNQGLSARLGQDGVTEAMRQVNRDQRMNIPGAPLSSSSRWVGYVFKSIEREMQQCPITAHSRFIRLKRTFV